VKELAGAPKDGVLVNSDSGNDIELFTVPGVRGCMVINGDPEPVIDSLEDLDSDVLRTAAACVQNSSSGLR